MKRNMVRVLSALLSYAFFAGCSVAPAETDEKETSQHIPIYAEQIKAGTYTIEVSSSSSMFRIVDAQLYVKEGKMSALLVLSGTGYSKLYMGKGEQALEDTDDRCIHYDENTEGMYTYEVPVEALNKDINCAAWSIRNEKWYNRVLVFQSSLIPAWALASVEPVLMLDNISDIILHCVQ